MHITDGQTDRRTDRRMDGQTDGRTDGRKSGLNSRKLQTIQIKNTIADYSIALQKREVRAYNAMKWYL